MPVHALQASIKVLSHQKFTLCSCSSSFSLVSALHRCAFGHHFLWSLPYTDVHSDIRFTLVPYFLTRKSGKVGSPMMLPGRRKCSYELCRAEWRQYQESMSEILEQTVFISLSGPRKPSLKVKGLKRRQESHEQHSWPPRKPSRRA